MSISKCPVCQSTDINSVTCNNCGAMLLFEGESKLSKSGLSDEKKHTQSMEDIIREILESSNVKTSPFEKIEYIESDNKTEEKNEDVSDKKTDTDDIEAIDPNKSFMDIAQEMGYTHVVEEEENADITDDMAQEENDNSETVTGDTGAFEMKVSKESNVEVSDVCDKEEDAETSDNYDEKTENRESDDLPLETQQNQPDEEDTSDVSLNEEKISLVEKISKKVNEKIRKETETSDNEEDEVDLFSPPEWAHSDKTVVKEYHKKKEKEQIVQKSEPVNMDIDTGFNKILNVCRFLLMISMLVTVVCMFLPSTRIGGFSSGQDVQIFSVISVIPFAVGFVLSITEKHYIRKYIYSLLASVAFAAVYFVFTLSIAGSSTKDIVYPILCSVISVISLSGIFVDKSSKVRKANTWFDAFAYILLFINIFMIMFIALFVVLVPDMVGGPEISLYLWQMSGVMIIGAVSAILILKRFSFGADLLIVSAIALIIVNIISYNKIMSAVSFDYTVNIPYMHYVGYVVAGVNILCTVFPMIMFFWMKHLMRVTPAPIETEE